MSKFLSSAVLGIASLGFVFFPAQSQAQTPPYGVQVSAGPVAVSAGVAPAYPVYPVSPAPVVVQPSVVYSPAYPVYSVAPSVVIRPGIVWRGGYYYHGRYWRR